MTVLRFPADEGMFNRLTEQQRLANIKAEQADAVRIARAVLRAPQRYSGDVLRDACAALQAWGDCFDHLTADAMIQALNQREQIARNKAAQTPKEVAMQHKDHWPEIMIWGAVIAAALLGATGWLS